METKRKYLAAIVAIALVATCTAGCISEENGGTGWTNPTQLSVADLSVDETNEVVTVLLSLGDKKDQVTKANGELRVAIFDSDGFEMLNKTFEVKQKDFESFEILGIKTASYEQEIPFADFAKSHDRGYGLEDKSMHGIFWFTYKGDTFMDTYDLGFINPTIPDALLHPNEDPTADLTGPSTGFTEVEVTFNASTSDDPEGGDLSYEWDWGDGETTTLFAGAEESHTYDEAGTFTVTVTVEDPEDATATDTMAITIDWAIAVTVEDSGIVSEGEYANQTYVTVRLMNQATEQVSVPDLDPWLLDTGDPVADNGTNATPPTSLAVGEDATIMIYFDPPEGFVPAKVKVLDREFNLP